METDCSVCNQTIRTESEIRRKNRKSVERSQRRYLSRVTIYCFNAEKIEVASTRRDATRRDGDVVIESQNLVEYQRHFDQRLSYRA